MNLATAFAASVTKRPHKTALFWGDREYSYAELWNQTNWVSDRLRTELGVKAGDRVGLWLKNCPEFVGSLFGILHSGAVAVPINNFLKPDEVNYILNDAGIDVLITDGDLGTHARALGAARPGLRLLKIEDLQSEPQDGRQKVTPHPAPLPFGRGEGEALPGSATAHAANLSVSAPPGRNGESHAPMAGHRVHTGPRNLAVLIYTSGTTGRPKGAMLSHGNLLHNVESCRIVLQTVELDRFVVLLPLFHSYMLTVGLLLPFLVGGSIVLVKSLHPVRNVLQEILQRQATVLPAIPQFYRSMANAAIPVPLPLRLCVSGAAPLPVQVLNEFEARFHIPLIEGYGLSEASPVVTKNPLDGTRKPGSIGLPIAHVEVSIQDEEGRMLPDKEIGELCVRGGNVMLGYWNKPEETAKVMRNGWLLTGDVGYRDSQGYYFITDRKKDMLLVNGINVYPREIEEVIYEFPGIKEAAVIGKPDSRKGEQPVAFIAANEGQTVDGTALRHFLRKRLADYKVPRTVVALPALPRNATGKILKTALRQLPVSKELARIHSELA